MSGITAFANICPTDCNVSLQFPAADVDQNCVPVMYLSEVTDIWIKPNEDSTGTPVTEVPYDTTAGWGTTTSHAIAANVAAIDNTVTDNTKVKWLTGIGDLPAADKATATAQKFTTVTIRRTYTFSFTVLNMSDNQYDFLRALQCNPLNFTFWYANTSHMYGKDTGICPTQVDVDFPLTSGEDSIESAIITLQFKAAVDPERRNNPYS